MRWGKSEKIAPEVNTQTCRGHRFQYQVPVMIKVKENQPVVRFDTEFIHDQRFVKLNGLIDSGASVSLVTEEVVESLKKQIVEAGNLTLSKVHDTDVNC